ncbi:hypothetical protein WMY93_002048 [Mugilogobius chulae]|uniref:FAM86 N-terminal domain-containing protein n=1 Tax=Mugilogobius chulae TaxID=88201 RepID=A0AAW0Q2H8_9GOBI
MSTEAPHSEIPHILNDFRNYFFSMSRLSSFPWAFVEKDLADNKSTDVISQILNQVKHSVNCFHPLCTDVPPSVRYRRLFISELIKRLEASDCDPLDELYDALAEVIGAEETTNCYKSYFLQAGRCDGAGERGLISGGTTGLVTWEAALYLAECVLELGSGVGLTGITVCSCCSPSEFVFSDYVVYDPVVVETLVRLFSRIVTSSGPDVFICSTVRNPETYRGFTEQLEKAGILHKVLPEPVTRIFPYNRESNIEIIKLYKKL